MVRAALDKQEDGWIKEGRQRPEREAELREVLTQHPQHLLFEFLPQSRAGAGRGVAAAGSLAWEGEAGEGSRPRFQTQKALL